ncbi:GL18135 [Drosophila persimilis]|uniref:GL18135 n=1 Tax=Drosophila persimilis TaxID=7234 RepID=B4H898_DROPE|nr:GL18135 [Drosophila persimilis]
MARATPPPTPTVWALLPLPAGRGAQVSHDERSIIIDEEAKSARKSNSILFLYSALSDLNSSRATITATVTATGMCNGSLGRAVQRNEAKLEEQQQGQKIMYRKDLFDKQRQKEILLAPEQGQLEKERQKIRAKRDYLRQLTFQCIGTPPEEEKSLIPLIPKRTYEVPADNSSSITSNQPNRSPCLTDYCTVDSINM